MAGNKFTQWLSQLGVAIGVGFSVDSSELLNKIHYYSRNKIKFILLVNLLSLYYYLYYTLFVLGHIGLNALFYLHCIK